MNGAEMEKQIRAKQQKMRMMIDEARELNAKYHPIKALRLLGKINKLEQEILRDIEELKNE